MKTKTINVYEYKELNEKAKKRARNWFLESYDMSFEWDCLKDDAKTIGIELTSMNDYKAEGELILDFSQVLANIIKEHGESCETYKTAKQYQEKYLKLTEEQEEEREELETEFLHDILEDYRILWKKDIEYHYSDKYIEDIMSANDYEFDENGKRV